MLIDKKILKECLDILVDTQKRMTVISDKQLVYKLKELGNFEVNSNIELNFNTVECVIEELSTYCSMFGYPLISSLVVSESTAKPTLGYCKMYKKLYPKIKSNARTFNSDWDIIWLEECSKIYYTPLDWDIVYTRIGYKPDVGLES